MHPRRFLTWTLSLRARDDDEIRREAEYWRTFQVDHAGWQAVHERGIVREMELDLLRIYQLSRCQYAGKRNSVQVGTNHNPFLK